LFPFLETLFSLEFNDSILFSISATDLNKDSNLWFIWSTISCNSRVLIIAVKAFVVVG
jgi:hypothetical protein